MPMPTVAGLVDLLGEHLAAAPGTTVPAAEITAVHVSELTDPTDYLEGGELLLTTGLTLPENRLGCDRYVQQLVSAGVVALGLGLGVHHDTVPEPLAQACTSHGLPLLLVPAQVPFLRITRTYWTARGASSRRELTDVISAHQSLVTAMTSDDPGGQVTRVLATIVRGWVALLSPDGRVERVYPTGRIGAAEQVAAHTEQLGNVRASASFTVADEPVLVLPLSVRDMIVGHLAIGSDRRLSAAEHRIALTASALLSLGHVRDTPSGIAERTRREAVAALLDLDQPTAARRLAAGYGLTIGSGTVRVLGLRARAEAADLVVRDVPRALPGGTAPAWFAVPDTVDARRLHASLLRVDPAAAMVLSGSVPLSAVHRTRLAVTDRLGDAPDGSLQLPTVATGIDAPAVIGRLTREPDLAAALAAWLRNRGSWEAAARDLGSHRNTVRHRIGRARALLDLDLDDPDVAAELWLALRGSGLA